MEKEKILKFDVCREDSNKILDEIWNDYKKKKQVVIVNVNPEIVTNNYKNEEFINNVNSQKYQIPDGVGILYASKIKKGKILERITGIDFMKKILEESVQYSGKVFFYGAKPEVAEMAKKKMQEKYKKIDIVGSCDGYVSEKEAIGKINNSKANILFVGLGSPKQENFIFSNKEKIKGVKIIMPVGGSFDVLSERLKRAPIWIQKANLEWLYRLVKQPNRIFRQKRLLKFIVLILKEKLFGNKKL